MIWHYLSAFIKAFERGGAAENGNFFVYLFCVFVPYGHFGNIGGDRRREIKYLKEKFVFRSFNKIFGFHFYFIFRSSFDFRCCYLLLWVR